MKKNLWSFMLCVLFLQTAFSQLGKTTDGGTAWTVVQSTFNVASFTPSRNALNIVEDTSISVTFNTDINPTTLNNSTILIHGSISGLHPGTFNYHSGTYTATMTPNVSFKLGEVVTVTLTRGITSASGDSMTNSYSWEFTIRNNSNSGLFQPSSTVGVGSSPWNIAAGDFDKDGSIDLAVVNNYSNNVSVLRNNGSGSFTLASTVAVGYYPGSIIAADLDGDGYMDLAVTNSGSGTLSILKNNGDGTFSTTSIASGGSSAWDVVAVDADGDGALDLAVVNTSSNNVAILKNNGSGTFALFSTVNVGTGPYSITAADWDGDGKMDLAVTNINANSVSILTNDGNGVFTQTATISVGSNPLSATAMDVNGDGAVDLAVCNNSSNSISVLENNGSGVFTLLSTAMVSGPGFKAAVDINGDGDMDLAVPGYDSLYVLQNNGSGIFTKKEVLGAGVGSGNRMIIAADLDNDGILELVGVNQGTNSVAIYKIRPKNALLRLSSTSLSFGSIAAGTTKSRYLKMYNDGTDSSLVVNNIVSSDSGFTVNKTSFTIPPMGTDSVLVTFSPATSGITYFDSLKISSNTMGNTDSYVALTGKSTTTGISNSNDEIPADYALLQNYPNPFNPSTLITYALPKDAKVSITVFNILGQQCLTLIDRFQLAGHHEVTFDTRCLPSGIYFYQMIAGSFVQTKKMALMK